MRHIVVISILIFFSTIGLIAQQVDMAKSLNNFSFDIYKQIKPDKGNLFFSPVSIDIAMLMAYEGANSDTKRAFEKVLHIDPTITNNEFLELLLNLKRWNDSSNYLNISNAIWIQQDKFKINEDYQKRIETKYSADAFKLDFSNKNNAAMLINKWGAEKTNSLIKNIISPGQIDDSTKLVITNAIYFIGKWADKFDTRFTKKDDFYSVAHEIQKIDFMHKTEYLDYFENGDFQFISKKYSGYDKSFCIFLPTKGFDFSEIEAKLCNKLIDSVFKNCSYTQVDLSMPKFKLETNYSLNESLIKLGLKVAFTDYADFSGISLETSLKISNVNHKAYIEVNEEETEAAAVTAIAMVNSTSPGGPVPKPKIFKADHPFIFMIIDNKTKGILFIGRYVQPK